MGADPASSLRRISQWLARTLWRVTKRLGMLILYLLLVAIAMTAWSVVVTVRLALFALLATGLLLAWVILLPLQPILDAVLVTVCLLVASAYGYAFYRLDGPVPRTMLIVFGIGTAALGYVHRLRIEGWREGIEHTVEYGRESAVDALWAAWFDCLDDIEDYARRVKPALKAWRPIIKGTSGEWQVRLHLARQFRESHRFHDIYLPLGTGVTQIDHVLLCTRGVFVIETKNWSATIYGDARSPQWRRHAVDGPPTVNPVHQNEGHVDAVCQAIEDEREIWNIVVFVGTGGLAGAGGGRGVGRGGPGRPDSPSAGSLRRGRGRGARLATTRGHTAQDQAPHQRPPGKGPAAQSRCKTAERPGRSVQELALVKQSVMRRVVVSRVPATFLERQPAIVACHSGSVLPTKTGGSTDATTRFERFVECPPTILGSLAGFELT